MYDDNEKTVYGGAHDNVGMTWFRPCRINGYPYCTLAHELGHSFSLWLRQMVAKDFRGRHSMSILLNDAMQVHPDWVTIENYH